MKSAIVAGILASVLSSQQAVATTYGWNDAQSFSSPGNCNNTCSSDQSGGYNWGSVPAGPISNFDGFDFSGFNCENSFNVRMGKRGLVRRTQFSGKAIVAQATTDDATCPKMSGQNKDFSITEMHVSVDKDSQLTFEYDMPDGSVCRQQSQCSVEGSVIKNTQCGGAQQVKVKGDCNFGFHSIIFDCQPGTSSSSSITSTTTVPVTTPTSSITTTTACAETETTNQQGSCVPTTTITTTTQVTTTTPASTTPTTTTTPVCADTESYNGQGSCVPKTTPSTTAPVTTPSTTTPVTTPATTTTTTAPTTPATTPATTTATCSEGYTLYSGSCVPQTPTGGSCATSETLIGGKCVSLTTNVSPVTPTCGSGQTPSGTGCVPLTTASVNTTPASSDLVTTEIVVTTLTSCPVTITSGSITSISITLSTTTITSTATFCPRCGETPPSTIGSTTVNAPPPPTPPTCTEGQELQNGQCVPKGPTGGTAPPPSTSTPAATTSCQSTESFNNGSCVPLTPTGGSGTPIPTPPVCNGNEELQNGQCVPKPPTGASPPPTGASQPPTGGSSPPAPPTTTTPPGSIYSSWVSVSTQQSACQEGEVQSNGQCVSQTPTGGVTTTSATVNAPPPETPVPEAPCPSVLPRCLSTWMSQAGSCSSNSDISCFCPSPGFIASVQECVSAWSGDDAQVQAALSYLVGICAKFVPQNPGICTGVPSTITLVPTPSAPAQAPPTGGNNAPAPTAPPFTGSMPSTVITFTQTLTSGSTVTQTVTVPQVVFNTVTQQVTLPGANGQPAQTQAQGVGLVPASPVTTPPAGPGNAPPAGSTPVAGQTGASTFFPSSTIGGGYLPGASGSQSGPSPSIQTFTGSATKTGYAVAAGVFGLIAFLA